jgi:hypothetical protein
MVAIVPDHIAMSPIGHAPGTVPDKICERVIFLDAPPWFTANSSVVAGVVTAVSAEILVSAIYLPMIKIQ